jgi:hypothetical protein
LVQRLTTVAEHELGSILPLADTAYSRSLNGYTKKIGKLDVCALYRLLQFGGVVATFVGFVWDSFMPSKVKFFVWLMVQSVIQSRTALVKKIITEDESKCPICDAARETAITIIIRCPTAFSVNTVSTLKWDLRVRAGLRDLSARSAQWDPRIRSEGLPYQLVR